MRSGTVVTIGILAAVLAADVARGATFHWGPRIGVSHTALAGEYARTSSDPARIAPSLGLATQLEFSSWLVGRAELNYARKGSGFYGQAVVRPAFLPAPPSGSWDLDYLDVPVLLRKRARHPSGHRYYLEAGPSVGIALAGRHGAERVRDDMKALDWGFATGVGFEFGRDEDPRVGIEGRYARGFSNLWRNADHVSSINESWTVSMVLMR